MAHGFHLDVAQLFRRRKLEMTFPAAQPFSARLHRLRWLLYVVLALVGGSLTFVGAHAQQKAWSSGNPDNAAKFYAKEDGLVFYDLAPFSYHSWKQYRVGVQKQFFDNASAVKLTAGEDLKVTRRGNIAWMTVPMHISSTAKDGKTTEADVRYTGIWERRGAGWQLVHEHLSVPMG
jgi:ketosteroid isomerase-like protein